MKKLVLLFTGLLIGLTTVTAETKSASQGEDLVQNRTHYAQPILFTERGVQFLIFPDGSFDFNTQIGQTQGDNYYRHSNSKRRSVNTTYGAPGRQVSYSNPRNRGMIVTHDSDGKVRRIGNVFLNYNRSGQIKRLGSVYIAYNRQGLVSQIGSMRLQYNRRGQLIKRIGQVNRYNTNNGHYEYETNNNDDYYYYKKGVKTKKSKLKKNKK
ncbi:hypothetical protein [Olleya sp. HaHaR_3_96]|uniref:hypothetical protein n=1 Tax=Olleya sp. HaHaR_3_96 TaxID=2745560 RepID=UPI001C4F7D9E|nr:hypothetical protein [Olleya sp. HaHaR_3_96]QXP59040.1 hypothetical protein H0I26_14095 [Olleya sp. HaHaR_3_96]